jgi:hypothetical protein
LFAALTALAERGINGERDNARVKLEKLKAKFDFDQPDPEGPDLFAGKFERRPGYTVPVCIVPDQEIAGLVKWAVEGRTGISCRLAGNELLAEATDGTARTLHGITATVADAFARLWKTFTRAGGLSGDRRVFMRGLFDGMMNEDRAPGQALPQRTAPKVKKGKRTQAPAIEGHPYTIAVDLGKKIRLTVPVATVDRELAQALNKQIAGEPNP